MTLRHQAFLFTLRLPEMGTHFLRFVWHTKDVGKLRENVRFSSNIC